MAPPGRDPLTVMRRCSSFAKCSMPSAIRRRATSCSITCRVWAMPNASPNWASSPGDMRITGRAPLVAFLPSNQVISLGRSTPQSPHRHTGTARRTSCGLLLLTCLPLTGGSDPRSAGSIRQPHFGHTSLTMCCGLINRSMGQTHSKLTARAKQVTAEMQR
jgi:hypothetical protein